MIWIFERAGKTSKLEVLYLAPDKYEVRFVDPDGLDRIEPFTNEADAWARQKDLELGLAEQGWTRTAGWTL